MTLLVCCSSPQLFSWLLGRRSSAWCELSESPSPSAIQGNLSKKQCVSHYSLHISQGCCKRSHCGLADHIDHRLHPSCNFPCDVQSADTGTYSWTLTLSKPIFMVSGGVGNLKVMMAVFSLTFLPSTFLVSMRASFAPACPS